MDERGNDEPPLLGKEKEKGKHLRHQRLRASRGSNDGASSVGDEVQQQLTHDEEQQDYQRATTLSSTEQQQSQASGNESGSNMGDGAEQQHAVDEEQQERQLATTSHAALAAQQHSNVLVAAVEGSEPASGEGANLTPRSGDLVPQLSASLRNVDTERGTIRNMLQTHRAYANWSLQQTRQLVTWAENDVNRKAVTDMISCELPDSFEGDRVATDDQVCTYLEEFVCYPAVMEYDGLVTETVAGKKAMERARRTREIAKTNNWAQESSRCIDAVASFINITKLVPHDKHVFREIKEPDPKELHYYAPTYCHHFDKGAALYLAGCNRNGARDNSLPSILSAPLVATETLIHCDQKLLAKRDSPDAARHIAHRRVSNERVNRDEYNYKRRLDTCLSLADVKAAWQSAKLTMEQKRILHEGNAGVARTVSLLPAASDNNQDAPAMHVSDGLGDPGDTNSVATDDEPNYKKGRKGKQIPASLDPVDGQIIIKIFPNVDIPSITGSARYDLAASFDILTCEKFPPGDIDITSSVLAAMIMTDYINRKGVPLDVLLVSGPDAREKIGLPRLPNQHNGKPTSIVLHHWLTARDRKQCKEWEPSNNINSETFFLNALALMQIDNVWSIDFRDALVIVMSAQWFDRDNAKAGESCIRAGVVGMGDSEEYPYFSLGKKKGRATAVLSQKASEADEAIVALGNEFVSFFRLIQNEVARRICYGEKDDSMWEWMSACDPVPSFPRADGDAPALDQLDDISLGELEAADQAEIALQAETAEAASPARKRVRLHAPVDDNKAAKEKWMQILENHFEVKGESRTNVVALQGTQANAYHKLRDFLTVIPGCPPLCEPLPPSTANANLSRAGPGSDYGPHWDAKDTLNSTGMHPNKTLSDKSKLDTRKQMMVFTVANALEPTCVETLVQHGDLSSVPPKPCTSMRTGPNHAHVQPNGAQCGGEHKGSADPNRVEFLPAPPNLSPDLPAEFLQKWLPKDEAGAVIPVSNLILVNARFVNTLRHVPLGGIDLEVYSVGYLAEKLDKAGIVYDTPCYTNIAFGRKKNNGVRKRVNWHTARGEEHFVEAAKRYVEGQRQESSDDVNTASLVIQVENLPPPPVQCGQVLPPEELWWLCHKPLVTVDEASFPGLNIEPGHHTTIGGIPLPGKMLRIAEQSGYIAMNATTTEIMLLERMALKITKDNGLDAHPWCPLSLHKDRKIPFGMGAIVGSDELELLFRDKNRDILNCEKFHQTCNHRYYKQKDPEKQDRAIQFAVFMNQYCKLANNAAKHASSLLKGVAGSRPRMEIPETVEELLEKCQVALQDLEDAVEVADDVPDPSKTVWDYLDERRWLAVKKTWKDKLANLDPEEAWLEKIEGQLKTPDSETSMMVRAILAPSMGWEKRESELLSKCDDDDSYQRAATSVLNAERTLNKDQVNKTVSEKSKVICKVAKLRANKREQHMKLLASLPRVARLLCEIQAKMDEDPLTQIGSSGAAMQEGANAMSATMSSQQDAHINSATTQKDSTEMNKSFSFCCNIGNAVAQFVSLENWMKVKRKVNNTGLKADDDYTNKFICTGYFVYDQISSNVVMERADVEAAFANCPGFVKSNASMLSFLEHVATHSGTPSPLLATCK